MKRAARFARRPACDDFLAVVAMMAKSRVKDGAARLGARGASLCCHFGVSGVEVGLG